MVEPGRQDEMRKDDGIGKLWSGLPSWFSECQRGEVRLKRFGQLEELKRVGYYVVLTRSELHCEQSIP